MDTISKDEALDIAVKAGFPKKNGKLSEFDYYHCYDVEPPNFSIYNMPEEPCWFVHAPWGDGEVFTLKSSRVILISKKNGKILYDGDAGDEG